MARKKRQEEHLRFDHEMNLDELKHFGKRDYEYPEDDHHKIKRSNLMKHLLIALHMREQLKELSDRAFMALDKDESGDLD